MRLRVSVLFSFQTDCPLENEKVDTELNQSREFENKSVKECCMYCHFNANKHDYVWYILSIFFPRHPERSSCSRKSLISLLESCNSKLRTKWLSPRVQLIFIIHLSCSEIFQLKIKIDRFDKNHDLLITIF